MIPIPAAQIGLLPEKPAPKARSKEELFAFQCRAMRLPPVVTQFRFAADAPVPGQRGKPPKPRQWRFDFAWPEYRLAVEIEGLVVRRIGGQLIVTGRHASVKGFKDDCEKYAAAALLGWTVLRFEQSQVKSGYAINMTQRVLYARGWKGPQ